MLLLWTTLHHVSSEFRIVRVFPHRSSTNFLSPEIQRTSSNKSTFLHTYFFEIRQGHFVVDWSLFRNVELLDTVGGVRLQFQLSNFAFRHLGEGELNTASREKQRFDESKSADGIWSLRTLRECFVGSLRRGWMKRFARRRLDRYWYPWVWLRHWNHRWVSPNLHLSSVFVEWCYDPCLRWYLRLEFTVPKDQYSIRGHVFQDLTGEIEQLDFKDKGRLRSDFVSGSFVTIGIFRFADQTTDFSASHRCHTDIPCFDDVALAQFEVEEFVAISATVELRPIK